MATTPKRFKEMCVWDIFRNSFEAKYRWEEIMSPQMYNFYDLFQKAYSCPIGVSFPTTLALVAAICGPETRMEIREDNFIVPLNLYNFIVSTPGGGKSVAYSKIVEPCLDMIQEEVGYSIQVESYTSAGLQRLHAESEGRAILVSDEGHRVLAAINAKQGRSEAERAFLNKMWGGKGDSTVLLEKARGFKTTSFSMILYIQPSPLLSEMTVMGGDDGFIDRIMFFCAKPRLQLTRDIMEANQRLLQKYQQDFLPKVLFNIYQHHHGVPTVYSFDDKAQEYYNNLADEHATEFNKRYDSSGKCIYENDSKLKNCAILMHEYIVRNKNL